MSAEMKDTLIGPIPTDWVCEDLEAFTSFISYGFTNPMPTTQSGPYMVTAADISDGRINFSTARRTSIEAFETKLTSKSKPRKNDVLLTKDGALGRVALVENETICINQSVAILRPNKRIEPSFFSHLLQADIYQKKMLEDAGGSTIKHIYITIVNRMPIAVPESIAEQRAIAAALSDADGVVAGLERVIAKKRLIKQGAMQDLLTARRRLPGFSGEWEMKRLGDVVRIATGGRNNQDKDPMGEFPFFVRSDTVERIRTHSYDCEAILVPGEGRIGEIFHYISGKFDVHQRVYCISGFSEEINGRFVYFVLRQFFGVHAMINTVKATVDSLRRPTFTGFAFQCPPTLDEQQAIAAVLSDMDAEIQTLESRLTKARAVKEGMMQNLLTGRVRLV